jgi:hypothetical protein
MTTVPLLHALVGTGGAWVIYLLILASVFSLAVIVERFFVLRRERGFYREFRSALADHLDRGDVKSASALVQKGPWRRGGPSASRIGPSRSRARRCGRTVGRGPH